MSSEQFAERNGSVARRRARAEVFLNLPYDSNFENLFLAYICAAHAMGLVPRVTLEIPGSAKRLDRIFALIRQCAFSIHDLFRVQLDRTRPRTPRFNMPFELGLAVAWEKIRKSHTCFVMETQSYRLTKSLSDLNGTDVYIHNGTVEDVFREMGNPSCGDMVQQFLRCGNSIAKSESRFRVFCKGVELSWYSRRGRLRRLVTRRMWQPGES
jgi:hypothetical protein